MKIIVVGCGKIGYTIARALSEEKGVHVVVVDNDRSVFAGAVEALDIKTVTGSGLYEKTLVEAGAKSADLIVAATGVDEVNILCCIMSKRLGTRRAVARLRKPEYAFEYNKLWNDLGIDGVINPDLQTAREISRLLRYRTADGIDTFISGMVELVSLRVSETPDFFVGKRVSEIFRKDMGILLAVVERNNNAMIPNGDFILEGSDVIRVLGRPSEIMSFFTIIREKPRKMQEVVIVGGGKITHYLAELLDTHNLKPNIKIIEKNMEKCEELFETLSEINRRCLIIHGDGTNENILTSEDVDKADAFICLTDRDEENVIISLYALRLNVKKVITKVNRIDRGMVKSLGLNSIIDPQSIASDYAVRYVKGLAGALGGNVRMMRKIYAGEDGNVEAAEFHLTGEARYLNVPIKDLKLKKGILLGCINRNNEIIIPSGETRMQKGDKVIVIAKTGDIHDFAGIMQPA
ncbi:MAG: Trk system potassium transporter TrkA [Oscillospiraceae bacterium]|nr:Trk system potassium transporter TrkA [Oscillospiraceae bacterium]